MLPVKTSRFIRRHQPDLTTLKSLLLKLGVPKTIRRPNGGYAVVLGNLPDERELWAAYESAKEVHRRLITRLHPDAGGNHEQAAAVNDLWRVIKRRFASRGIG